jgi:hypothetical protein
VSEKVVYEYKKYVGVDTHDGQGGEGEEQRQDFSETEPTASGQTQESNFTI